MGQQELSEKQKYILDAIADDASRLSCACRDVLAYDHPGSRTRLTRTMRDLTAAIQILQQTAA